MELNTSDFRKQILLTGYRVLLLNTLCVCGMLNFGKDMLNSALIVNPRCPLMLRHMLDCGVTLSEACLALLAWTEGPVLWPSWPVGRLH